MSDPASPATRRGPGRPPRHAEDKRERILGEATRVFARSGYAAASLSEIAAAAEITKAGLLHHFGSKSGLFATVLDRRDAIDAAGFPADADVWQLLDAFVALVEHNATTPELVGLYVTMTGEGVQGDGPAHDWLRRHFSRATEALVAGFEAGKAAGRVRADAPSADLARVILATADGSQVQWLCDRADGTADDLVGPVRLVVDLVRGRWALPAA